MEVKVKDGQTLADMGIQEFGSWEAMIAIARENNMSMSETPATGMVLAMPDATWNRIMEDYYRNNDVSPATARDQSDVHLRVFGEEFKKAFK